MSIPIPKKPITLPLENQHNANEYRDALQFNSTLRPRRDSLQHTENLHAAIPRLIGLAPTQKDFENIIKNGAIECYDLFGLLLIGSEVAWQPDVKRAPINSSNAQQPSPQAPARLSGRDQIRTGRKFEMKGAKGEIIRVRIHTQDHMQDEKKSNAGKGSIVRVEFGKELLLSERDTFLANSSLKPSKSFWTKNAAGESKANSSHIPLGFNPVQPGQSSAMQTLVSGMNQSASYSFSSSNSQPSGAPASPGGSSSASSPSGGNNI